MKLRPIGQYLVNISGYNVELQIFAVSFLATITFFLWQIVTREAIPYGPEDSCSISSLVNWVLPYAQRYIFNADPDKYFQLKQSCFEHLRHLKIVVVEKLFYRYKIKRWDITSKRRHKCNCLLQVLIAWEASSVLLSFNDLSFISNFFFLINACRTTSCTAVRNQIHTQYFWSYLVYYLMELLNCTSQISFI